ncbi:hypothetical protein HZS61_002813 [Fusarium oxysporum f. sp. conglutinans]|uniref:Fungal N-terminal domain-containing protein n=3 Tax=Fusarium oxysporum f. sp. conglutinans TaxID=100902 RepID=A0A8H6GGC1_FUSOX|nr:hypothetical protein HZS61_002813 [Fusarium oxysporum f. sp. conglutinans]
MDPLSIASGVAGLLTVSAAVIKTFDTVKTSIENCPRTVFWAHAETKEINWAIKRLKSLIDDPDSVPKAARMSVGIHDATVTISELIKTCDHLITTLKPLNEDGKVVLTRWDRVKWLRVQDDVVKYIRQLQAHKGSVTLILNILQCESDVVIVESQRALELKIDAVLNSSEATQRRIEGLEALFNKFITDNSTLIPSNRTSMAPTLHHWKEDDATETDSVATSRKYDQDEWGGFHASAERSLSFPTASVPELGMPKLKRSTSAETSTKSESTGTTSPPLREFEATLEKTNVYKRVYNSTDAFSIHSTHGRSMTDSVMTSFSLADDSSILSAFPIMSRTELQHPEFYTQMSGNQRISRDLMRAITTRSVVKSPVEPPPGAPFSLKQFRSPPNCGENVMGRWHQSRTKVWRPKEFRTEIQFEVPVIFVSTSKTAKGPIDGADVFLIDGTRKSLDDTWTDLEPPTTGTFTKTGRFIKNERATWLSLLSSLQKMENESQNWTRQQIMGLRPRPASATAILTSIAGKHTLNVALQREKKSWDDMPPSINRPYATTSMSSLIEMLAMLGIYWKDFNTFHHVYQAEGNGFLVKGHKISGLGIMFHFQALEKAVFEGKRTIPTKAVKRLAFGQLPTIFTEGHPEYKSSNSLYEWPNVGLGSRTEIAETLFSLGCGRKAVNYFLRDGAVTSHIFPEPEVSKTKPRSRKMSESRSPRPKRAAALRANERLLEPELLWKAFEKAKPRMCGQAAKKTIEAMEFHRQCPDYESPSKHPFYIRIKGKRRIDDPELYYYPYLLVLQAIWPYSEHVQTIAKAFARYWGVPDMWRGPEHYPMLNDRDREMELFMGLKPRETEAREDESSAGNGEDNEEDEEDVKQENEEEQEQEQEDEQGEEQDEEQEHEQEQQLEGEQNEDDEEQEEQQDEGDEDTIPDISDIDAITDIDKLDKLESILEVRENKLMYQIQETKERVRKVQENKRDLYRKKSSASKKAAERLQVRLDAERMVSDHWATKEREYIKKLERSSATSSVISPPPEQESERPAKRQRAAGQKE